jgi:hypothetical protein
LKDTENLPKALTCDFVLHLHQELAERLRFFVVLLEINSQVCDWISRNRRADS